MFFLLRFCLVVGTIFYLSPVRQGGDPLAALASLFGWASDGPAGHAAAPSGEPSAKLETVWQALPEAARQAVVDEILVRSGVGSQRPGSPNAGSPRQAATDTLLPGDRRTAWRGEPQKP